MITSTSALVRSRRESCRSGHSRPRPQPRCAWRRRRTGNRTPRRAHRGSVSRVRRTAYAGPRRRRGARFEESKAGCGRDGLLRTMVARTRRPAFSVVDRTRSRLSGRKRFAPTARESVILFPTIVGHNVVLGHGAVTRNTFDAVAGIAPSERFHCTHSGGAQPEYSHRRSIDNRFGRCANAELRRISNAELRHGRTTPGLQTSEMHLPASVRGLRNGFACWLAKCRRGCSPIGVPACGDAH